MAYASASQVGSYTRNILGEFPTFTQSSCPTITQVNGWLSTGCAIIEARLAGAGYSVPVSAGVRAYDWISDLNAVFAAARAEMSRTVSTISPDERTRSSVLEDMFWSGLDQLSEIDLSSMGIDRASRGQMYAGGISVADKQTQEDDSDRVKPKFSKGMFRFPETVDPNGSTAS